MDDYGTVPSEALRRHVRQATGPGTAGATIFWSKKPRMRDQVLEFAQSTVTGLGSTPRRLECRFLYDATGSLLFDRITRQPEYYLTRTESSILAANAHRIRSLAGPVTIVELGSGSSLKTEYLLQAWLKQAPAACYVPVDVSETALLNACRSITAAHPALKVIGIHAQYEESFDLFREMSPMMLTFLGSSIGNLSSQETDIFLRSLSSALLPGDLFLLGVDLVKESGVIEAAYNDKAGVTAAFTRNIFARMNRELASRIELSAIEHVATYDPDKEQVNISGYFHRGQQIKVAPLGKNLFIPGGEQVEVEISRKFRIERLLPEIENFGFITEEVFTDSNDYFALMLFRRREMPLEVMRGKSG